MVDALARASRPRQDGAPQHPSHAVRPRTSATRAFPWKPSATSRSLHQFLLTLGRDPHDVAGQPDALQARDHEADRVELPPPQPVPRPTTGRRWWLLCHPWPREHREDPEAGLLRLSSALGERAAAPQVADRVHAPRHMVDQEHPHPVRPIRTRPAPRPTPPGNARGPTSGGEQQPAEDEPRAGTGVSHGPEHPAAAQEVPERSGRGRAGRRGANSNHPMCRRGRTRPARARVRPRDSRAGSAGRRRRRRAGGAAGARPTQYRSGPWNAIDPSTPRTNSIRPHRLERAVREQPVEPDGDAKGSVITYIAGEQGQSVGRCTSLVPQQRRRRPAWRRTGNTTAPRFTSFSVRGHAHRHGMASRAPKLYGVLATSWPRVMLSARVTRTAPKPHPGAALAAGRRGRRSEPELPRGRRRDPGRDRPRGARVRAAARGLASGAACRTGVERGAAAVRRADPRARRATARRPRGLRRPRAAARCATAVRWSALPSAPTASAPRVAWRCLAAGARPAESARRRGRPSLSPS